MLEDRIKERIGRVRLLQRGLLVLGVAGSMIGSIACEECSGDLTSHRKAPISECNEYFLESGEWIVEETPNHQYCIVARCIAGCYREGDTNCCWCPE